MDETEHGQESTTNILKRLLVFATDSLADQQARSSVLEGLSLAELRKLVSELGNRPLGMGHSRVVADVAANLFRSAPDEATKYLKEYGASSFVLPRMASKVALYDVSAALSLVKNSPIQTGFVLDSLAATDASILAKALKSGQLAEHSDQIQNRARGLALATGAAELEDLAENIAPSELKGLWTALAQAGGGDGSLLALVIPQIDSGELSQFSEQLGDSNPRVTLDLIESGLLVPEEATFSALLNSERLPPSLSSSVIDMIPLQLRPSFAGTMGTRLGYDEALQALGGDVAAETRDQIARGAFRDKVMERGGSIAMTEAMRLSDPSARTGALSVVCEAWGKSEPNTVANALIKGDFGQDTTTLFSTVLPSWNRIDPAGMADWLAALSTTKPDVAESLKSIVSDFSSDPHPGIKEWLNADNPSQPGSNK